MKKLFGFGLISLLLFTACSSDKKIESCKVTIYDKANIFQPNEEKKIAEELASYARQLKADISIVTDSTVELWRLSIAGDKAKDAIPSNKHWWHFWRYEDSADDIIFYYTEQPHLLQIRYGKKLRMQVRKAGLDTGELYRSIQKAAIADDKNISFLIPIEKIKLNWVQYEELSSTYRRVNLQMIERLIENIALPDLKFWYKLGDLISIRFAKLITKVTNSFPYWIVLLFLLGWLLKKLVEAIFNFLWKVLISKAKTVYPFGAKIGAFCFALLITLPSASMFSLALSGRLEDKLALEAITGSAFVHQIPIFPTHFASKVYWISCGFIVLFGIISVLFEDPRAVSFFNCSPEKQKSIYLDMDDDEQQLYKMKFISLLALSKLHSFTKVEYEDSLEEKGVTEEKFDEMPFSSVLEAKLYHEARPKIGRRIVAILILPPFMGAWFLLTSIFEAIVPILKIPKAIKFRKYYSESI